MSQRSLRQGHCGPAIIDYTPQYPNSSAINVTIPFSCNLAYNVSRDELTVLSILQLAK